MSLPPKGALATLRQCPYCGYLVLRNRDQCPSCRESLPAIRAAARAHAGRHGEIRRGLLYMLLGAVVYYFTGGFGAINLPITINPLVATYLAPLIFLNGLGFTAYEYFRSKSA